MYLLLCIFFFNDTATTEIYTLSLHDALPICEVDQGHHDRALGGAADLMRDQVGRDVLVIDGHEGERALAALGRGGDLLRSDRKSTRLNSSHANISYAVFCLKKKK